MAAHDQTTNPKEKKTQVEFMKTAGLLALTTRRLDKPNI